MFKLQLFNEAVAGRQIVYLYRQFKKAATEDAWVLAFTTDNSRNLSKDAESTATKDGMIRTPGTADVSISAASLLRKGDPNIDETEDAMLNDELFEIWEANLAEPGTGANKFKGKYFQGYMTQLDRSAAAEGFVELSFDFSINGQGKKGEVTVSATQQEVASYSFTDSVKTGA